MTDKLLIIIAACGIICVIVAAISMLRAERRHFEKMTGETPREEGWRDAWEHGHESSLFDLPQADDVFTFSDDLEPPRPTPTQKLTR